MKAGWRARKKGQEKSLCQELGLIQLVHRVQAGMQCFPEFKATTGCVSVVYTLEVDPTVKPEVHAPRRQPNALREKIVNKLKEIKKQWTLIRPKKRNSMTPNTQETYQR